MAMPEFTMRQLMEAGVHFGHHTRRWNPQMREYIFGVRNGVHIIDLQKTEPLLNEALKAMRDIVAKGGRVLFVGTKRQASDKIAESAKRCGQYYVNHRWLGGMLTNWQTITGSINRYRELEGVMGDEAQKALRTKKELLMMMRERDKLELSIGGIKDMGGQADAVFIIDTTKEDIAIKESNKLGIPVFAIVDTNADVDGVDYVIPGNDDALRAIDLYCNLFAEAVLDGLQAEMATSNKDTGANVNAGGKLPPKIEIKKEEDAPTPGEAMQKKAETKKEDAKDNAANVETVAEPEEEKAEAKKVAGA